MKPHLHLAPQPGLPADRHAQAKRDFTDWRDRQRVEMVVRYERPSAWRRLMDWLRS